MWRLAAALLLCCLLGCGDGGETPFYRSCSAAAPCPLPYQCVAHSATSSVCMRPCQESSDCPMSGDVTCECTVVERYDAGPGLFCVGDGPGSC